MNLAAKDSKIFENDEIDIVKSRPESSNDISNGITLEEAEAIENLSDVKCLNINEGKWAKINRKRDKLKLGQYVGLITIGKLSFEILPKVENSNNKNTQLADLRTMILLADKFRYSSRGFDNKSSTDDEEGLLESITKSFFEKVNIELIFGLRRTYNEYKESIPSLRGRLNLNEFALNYCRRPHLLPCIYDEFTEDSRINQIIKQAVSILVRHPKFSGFNSNIKNLGFGILDGMTNVSDTRFSYSDVQSIKTSRLESRYSDLLEFSKNIIRGNEPFIRPKGDQNLKAGFTMVWEMSSIYESAIAQKFEEYFKGSKYNNTYRVIKQGIRPGDLKLDNEWGHHEGNQHLAHESDAKNTGRFLLKPDIMILNTKTKKVVAVLDTKWKNYKSKEKDDEDYKSISREDAYQMLSYASSKRPDGSNEYPVVGLLCPSLEPIPTEVLEFTNTKSKFILSWVPVTEVGLNNFELQNIFGNKLNLIIK